MKVIGDPAWRKDYDPMYDEGKILKKIGHQIYIGW
jgi:hypothetical protein